MSDTFIVTGASSGIGRATAARLEADGFKVFNLDKAAPEGDSAGQHIATDLGDVDAIRETIGNIAADNALVGLVNNAGYAVAAPLEETTPEIMEMSYRINVLAPAMCAQAVLPSMKERGHGRIVNIISRAALGRELRTGYAGTKGNLMTMTRVWALELARHGITVNAIGPGPVGTELYNRMNPPDSPRTKSIAASVPVGRIGTPDDIANAVAFFADRRSSFVNGQVLYVCGGLTIGAGPL
jgi:3-oxoacyl-[acyl-carrier protein] reductase